ncbi:MAG: YegS/Rv2252/BmrU family lipid kinase [Ferruginibacter sp.]
MQRSLIFLVNPISGGGNKDKVVKLIEQKTKKASIPYRILPTDKDGNYTEVKKIIASEKITDVIICGGDGSVNQAVSALRHLKINFGIIPLGSGNGLAFAAGIPKSPSKALEMIYNGSAGPVDAFKINEHFSCMLSGLGFDADVAHTFANQTTRGLSTYIIITIKTFIVAKSYPFTLIVNNEKMETDALFISIANSNQFGNNFKIAPRASLSDGLLDIVVVKKMNKVNSMAKMTAQLFRGRLTTFNKKDVYDGIHYFQTENITIENHGNASLHIDGEPVSSAKKVEVQIIKHAFNLIKE